MKSFYNNYPQTISKEPEIRILFQDSGIDLYVIFNTIAHERSEIASDIRREIFKNISKTEDVEFAYPHRELILRDSKKLLRK